uniref:Dynein regulatory complex subunit 4 n=1 Tax=Xiphophorus maculatus TaxID=8083 RepID=A0A3B5PSS9_XIPMA
QPPKKGKKGKKGKAGKLNPFMLLDSAPIQDMSKDQLWDFALRIQEELETVRKEKSLFQLERNKTQTVWETTKKNLEESEVELRSTTAERSEVDEKHREEMTVYKQKMKHVLTEQHNAVSAVKTDAVTSRSLQQKQNTELELDLRRQLRDLQMDNKEKRLQEHSSIKMLKLVRRRSSAAASSFGFCLILPPSLFQGELKKLQNQKLRWEKKISAAQQENQRLKTTLQEVQQKLPELHRRLQEHQHSKQRMELVDQELRDLTVEHELLLQAFHKVQQERDELLRRQTQSILDVQQRSGLKKILLQRKMEALSQTLEKKEAQLSAALSVCSVEPTARSNAALKLQVRGRRAAPLGGTGTSPQVLIRSRNTGRSLTQEQLIHPEGKPDGCSVSCLRFYFYWRKNTLKYFYSQYFLSAASKHGSSSSSASCEHKVRIRPAGEEKVWKKRNLHPPH